RCQGGESFGVCPDGRRRKDCPSDLSAVLPTQGKDGSFFEGRPEKRAIPGLPGKEQTGIKEDRYSRVQRKWKVYAGRATWEDHGSPGCLPGCAVMGQRVEAEAFR